MTATKRVVPPNGGWGWIVVLGVAVSNATNQSLVSVYSLLFGETLELWGLETTGVSVISNTLSAVMNFSGILAGTALKRFGPRRVALVGGSLVTTGLLLCAMSTKPWQILIAWGCIVGLGFGLNQAATFLAVTSYFTTRRGQAVGISLAGTGAGQMAMPHLVRYLLETFGFHGAVLILAGVALHSVPAALLYQPVRYHSKPEQEETRRESCETDPLKGPHVPPTEVTTIAHVSKSQEEKKLMGEKALEAGMEPERRPLWRRAVAALDLDLLCNGPFLSLAIGAALIYTATVNFSMIFPLFLREGAGISVSQTATCMSALSGMDLAARLVLPAITDRLRAGARTVLLIGALTSAATRSGMAPLTGFPELLAMAAVSGFCRGATVLNQGLSMAEHVSPARLPAAIGLSMVVKGATSFIMGPLLGMVRDMTGSYALFIHALSGLVALTACLWLLECAFCSTNQRSRAAHQEVRS